MNDFNLKELGEENFNPADICPDVPFTQDKFYGDWQRKIGRPSRRFVVFRRGEAKAYFQIIKYPLILGKSYFYCPYGPVVSEFSEELMNFLKSELLRIAKEENVVFTRLDFTPIVGNASMFFKSPAYTYHSAYFQPRYE